MVEVPQDQLVPLHVSQHPVAATMDVENNNYIVPRDGSWPEKHVDLDGLLGDLRGNLGNFLKLKEAEKRIVEELGRLASDEEKGG